MATAKRVFHQIEINFWNRAIPILSDTPELHGIVRSVGRLVARYHKLPRFVRTSIWAFAGGIIGLFLGAFGGALFI